MLSSVLNFLFLGHNKGANNLDKKYFCMTIPPQDVNITLQQSDPCFDQGQSFRTFALWTNKSTDHDIRAELTSSSVSHDVSDGGRRAHYLCLSALFDKRDANSKNNNLKDNM